MKTPNLIVRIPEPCHEDWNSMQPDEKGKFCNSCSKAVFDFSNKTDHEMSQILINYKDQNVCGHFKKSQVDRPLNLKVNLNDLPKNISFSKVFVIAVFLIFGSFLFSCTDHQGGKMETIEILNFNKESSIDGLILVDMQSSPVDSINAVMEAISEDTLSENPIHQKFSEDKFNPELNPEEMMTGDLVYVEEYLDEGSIVIEAQYGETNSEGNFMDTVNLDEVLVVDFMEPLIDGDMIQGGMRTGAVVIEEYAHCFGRPIINYPASITNEVKGDDLKMINAYNEFNIYPNPSNGEFTINYGVRRRSNVSLTIFNMNGVLMRTIIDIANQYDGKYQIPVNLSELPNGIYLVTMIIDEKKVVERLVIER